MTRREAASSDVFGTRGRESYVDPTVLGAAVFDDGARYTDGVIDALGPRALVEAIAAEGGTTITIAEGMASYGFDPRFARWVAMVDGIKHDFYGTIDAGSRLARVARFRSPIERLTEPVRPR